MATNRQPRVDLSTLTPGRLGELGDDEFRWIVDADLKRRASNENVRTAVPGWVSDALRSTHLEQWVMTLRRMEASVEGQLEMATNEYERDKARLRSEANDDVESKLAQLTYAYHQRRAGPLRFRAGVQEALPEAESLYTGRLRHLEEAIRAHREASLDDDQLEPADFDRRLWSLIES